MEETGSAKAGPVFDAMGEWIAYIPGAVLVVALAVTVIAMHRAERRRARSVSAILSGRPLSAADRAWAEKVARLRRAGDVDHTDT